MVHIAEGHYNGDHRYYCNNHLVCLVSFIYIIKRGSPRKEVKSIQVYCKKSPKKKLKSIDEHYIVWETQL